MYRDQRTAALLQVAMELRSIQQELAALQSPPGSLKGSEAGAAARQPNFLVFGVERLAGITRRMIRH